MNYPSPQPAPARPFLSQALPYILMLLVGYLAAVWYGQWKANQLHDPDAEPRPVTQRGDLAEDEKSTIELFRTNAPSVVYIRTSQIEFDRFSLDATEMNPGHGSGFVWDRDGHIVTNDHVIASADVARVSLSEQSVWDAKIVGRAPGKDLAVLKIMAPAEKLEPIMIGQSNDLVVGQKVFAIGNPFGLDQTLTTGVISALDREIRTSENTSAVAAIRTIDGVIQTDAAINPGNSGGPLLDSAGRLIGVNTAIYSPSGAYAGIGFAIPVDTVNRIVPELIRHGKIIRPSIGIVPFQDRFTPNLTGVLVREVLPNSPAQQAGIQPTRSLLASQGRRVRTLVRYGDLIVSANDQPIGDLNDWLTFLESQKAGNTINLTIIRNLRRNDEETITLPLTLIPSP